MVLGRAREALSDVAQTIRRLFGEPRVTTLVAPEPRARAQAGALLAAQAHVGLERPGTLELAADLFQVEPVVHAMAPLAAELRAEQGWEAWGSEARLLDCPLFEAGRGARLEVPPLPAGARVSPLREPFRTPEARRADPGLAPGKVFALDPGRGLRVEGRSNLGAALARPFVFLGEDLGQLPKALWMRYSLALVKATGENVRNLEVVGLYRLPRRGVGDVKPDAQGRLWVRLTAEAAGAKRAAFMLARRRDDQAYISAFVEDP